MNQEILDYLKGERVCVLAMEMLDGSPHGSAIHFAHLDDPFIFIFKTDRDYRKCEPLFGKDKTRATVVVGLSEQVMRTFQLDGTAQLLQDEALKEVYMQKFPEKRDKADGPKVVYFTFTPTWWRFTDWTKPGGKTISTSDGKVVVMGK